MLQYQFLAVPTVKIIALCLFVLMPWALIIYRYMKEPFEIYLTHESIQIASRIKKTAITWQEVESVYIAHHNHNDSDELSLIIMPIDKSKEAIEIDLNYDTSIIKAKEFLIAEIERMFGNIKYLEKKALGFEDRPTLSI